MKIALPGRQLSRVGKRWEILRRAECGVSGFETVACSFPVPALSYSRPERWKPGMKMMVNRRSVAVWFAVAVASLVFAPLKIAAQQSGTKQAAEKRLAEAAKGKP